MAVRPSDDDGRVSGIGLIGLRAVIRKTETTVLDGGGVVTRNTADLLSSAVLLRGEEGSTTRLVPHSSLPPDAVDPSGEKKIGSQTSHLAKASLEPL